MSHCQASELFLFGYVPVKEWVYLLLNVLPLFFGAILFTPIVYALALAVSMSGLEVVLALTVLVGAPFWPLWRERV